MNDSHKRRIFDPRRDKTLVALAGILALLLTVCVFYNYMSSDWRYYQKQFRVVVEETLGADKAAGIRPGIQQIYLSELNRSDRCVTCHMGMEWKGLENVDNPYRSHPAEILKEHPLSKFGCVLCHGGQGHSVEYDDAHGLVKDWEAPLLGSSLAEFYAVAERKSLLQTHCNECHRYDKETAGADQINRAKKLVMQKGCRACHVINGRGGTVGPDLTREGDKSPDQFGFERINGAHSQFSWHVAHFKDPKGIVQESVMPNFGFSGVEAQALAMLVMSWHKTNLPLDYIPGTSARDVPTREELEKENRMSKGPGAMFVQKRCFICHSISTFGIDAATQIGPDLAIAATDVQSRFGRTLEDFLAKPTGTMSVVLSTMITLTPEERAMIVEKLKYAHALLDSAAVAAKTKH